MAKGEGTCRVTKAGSGKSRARGRIMGRRKNFMKRVRRGQGERARMGERRPRGLR